MTKRYILVCSRCGCDKWEHHRDKWGRKYKFCSAWFGCTSRRGKYMEANEWVDWMMENYGTGEWP